MDFFFFLTIPIQTIFTGAEWIYVPNWNTFQALAVLPKLLRFKIIWTTKTDKCDETGCQVVKYSSLGVYNNHTGNCLWNVLRGFVVLEERMGAEVVSHSHLRSGGCSGRNNWSIQLTSSTWYPHNRKWTTHSFKTLDLLANMDPCKEQGVAKFRLNKQRKGIINIFKLLRLKIFT